MPDGATPGPLPWRGHLLAIERYRVHRFTLAVEADDPEVAAVVARRLGHFASSGGDGPEVTFRIHAAAPADSGVHPAGAPPFYQLEGGTATYLPESDRMILTWGKGARLEIDPGRSRLEAWHRPGVRARLTVLPRLFLTIALIEIGKRRGLHAVHAAGIGRGGRALILAGASGSGKSTLALAAVGGGFDYLGDDLLFLLPQAAGGAPGLLGLPGPIDVDARSLAWFPAAAATAMARAGVKHAIEPHRLGASIATEARPAAIVFPARPAPSAASLSR